MEELLGILDAAFAPRPAAAAGGDPLNDFWYSTDPSGFVYEAGGGSGLSLSAETILRCSTVLAAVRFRADLWAMSPPVTFRQTRFGRAEDPAHYSQVVLRNPNRWQTGNRWRHLNGVWLATWGNAYSEIIAGQSSFAEELRPLHPMWTRVVDQREDGSLLYRHEPAGEPARMLGQERVLHFRELGTDGTSGLQMYRLIRNVVGIALLAEKHQMNFLKKGSRLAGFLVPDSPLGEEQRKELRESVNQEAGGPSNAGTLGILPSGIDLKPFAMTHREGQMIELSDRAVSSILMMLGVPGVVVGWQGDKTSTYASAEAYFEKGGIRHTALPMLTNIEAEEEKALLIRGDGRQIKHNLDALLRGAWKDRIQGLVKAAGGPILTRNEARGIEDYDQLPGEENDELLTPSNMMGGQDETEPDPEPQPPPAPPRPTEEPEDDEEDAQASRALEAQLQVERERSELKGRLLAEKVVRRETRHVTEKARAHSDSTSWEKWVRGYYARHVIHVEEAMGCSEQNARVHCERQVGDLLKNGIRAVETWEHGATARLAAIAGEKGN